MLFRSSFRGRQSNIVDVGYGVSQILPILTELIEAPTHSSFLFQQPEVHLHPRAQAALGSFFAKYIAEHRGSFLIAETHSDYLIDRVRREARNKRIPYQDIAILYFASEGNKTVIHQMSVSKDGDIVNPPDSYRDFFVREQMAMLGIETH